MSGHAGREWFERTLSMRKALAEVRMHEDLAKEYAFNESVCGQMGDQEAANLCREEKEKERQAMRGVAARALGDGKR
jgi:hypothetical protein